ncbi:MAG: autotransporter domain-containing protein [Verrucomicrobiota bacterium]
MTRYTITNVISGTGKLNQVGGGTTVLTADNTYFGGTSISNGIVQVGDGGSTGSLGSGGVTNHGTLIFNRSNNITIDNLITGSGSVRQLGSNTITLTANNDYTGATTISSNGTIRVGDGGTSGSLGSGAVVNGGSLIFNRSDSLTNSGSISGAGSVTNVGAGTTILTGNNTYSGLTVISAGTLQLGNGGNTGSLGTNQVINNGVLAFNRTNDLTFANVISGSGSLTHLGSGMLTLSGTNTFSGGTTVNGGGTLQPLNSQSLGNGNVNLANGTLQAYSLLSTGLVMNIGGNYVQGASGTLNLRVAGSIAASNDFDQLKIVGGANLDGTLHVGSANSGYQPKHTDKIELVVATGGLSGTFSTFTNDIAHSVLLTPELVYDADSVTLAWNQMSFMSFLTASNVNLTVNQKAAAVAVDSILTSTNATDVALVSYLDNLSNLTNSLPAAFDQVAPEELTAMMGAAFSAMDAQGNQFLRRVANLQLDYQRLYQSTLGRRTKTRAEFDAYVNRPWDLYFELPFNSASVASDANAPGYDLSSSGFTVGGDGRLSENVIVGTGINYLKTGADPDSGGSVDMETLSAQVYGTWFNATGLHFEGLLGAGINSYDTLRQGVGGVASGSADGTGVTAVFGGGYNWENGPWQFGPSLAFQYMNASINEFTESGSLSPLRVASQSEDAMHSQLGLSARYNYQVADSWTFITPEVSLGWRHDFLDESIALSSQFASGAGTSFVINSAEMGGDSVIIGIGCSVQWKPALNTYLNFTLQRGSSGYDSEFLNLGLRYSF